MAAKLPYSWKKPGSSLFYFRRRVPEDVIPLLACSASPHAGKRRLVLSLKTTDPKVAAARIAKLVKQTNEDWEELRNPTRGGGILHQAYSFLTQHGVDPYAPEKDRQALDAFLKAIEVQLPSNIKADPFLEHGPHLDGYLSPVYLAAFQIAQGRREVTLTDCRDQYAIARPSTARTAGIAFRYLQEYLGTDKAIRNVRRAEVNGFVQHLLAGKHNGEGALIGTSTVARYLGALKAAFGRAIRENELRIDNVFVRVDIPNKGADIVERETFSIDQYHHLFRAIDAHNRAKGPDQLRCILTLLAETGARLAEVVGLAVDDIHAHATVPFVDLREHPWRPLKTRSSIRRVPLTPRALEAAQTAIHLADGSPILFPHYATETETRAASVSTALVKWMRTREGLTGTRLGNHSLRHGMEDLLRAAGCPDSVRDQISGHKTPGMGANYGEGYPLAMLADWLAKAAKISLA